MVEYHLKILGENEAADKLIDISNGFSVGSAGTNDLCLKSQGIEKHHCTFRVHNDILSIYTHESSKATAIDDFPLKPGKSYIIDQGDTIIIGDKKLKIYKNAAEFKDANSTLEESLDIEEEIAIEDDIELEEEDISLDDMDDAMDLSMDEDLDIEEDLDDELDVELDEDLIEGGIEIEEADDFEIENDPDLDIKEQMGEPLESINSESLESLTLDDEDEGIERGSQFEEEAEIEVHDLAAEAGDTLSEAEKTTHMVHDIDEDEVDLFGDADDGDEGTVLKPQEFRPYKTDKGFIKPQKKAGDATLARKTLFPSADNLNDDSNDEITNLNIGNETAATMIANMDKVAKPIDENDANADATVVANLGDVMDSLAEEEHENAEATMVGNLSDMLGEEDDEPDVNEDEATMVGINPFANDNDDSNTAMTMVSDMNPFDEHKGNDDLLSLEDIEDDEESTFDESKLTKHEVKQESTRSDTQSSDVFSDFEFKDDASGLLGSKDVQKIKEEVLDKMETDLSGINILPVEENNANEQNAKANDTDPEEVDFSFGDEYEGPTKLYTPEDSAANKSHKVEQLDLSQESENVTLSDEVLDMSLDDDDEGTRPGRSTTGVIDLGEEKTKLLQKRKSKGEELFPGSDQEIEKIGVDPLPPVSEFRPEKREDNEMPASVEDTLQAAQKELKSSKPSFGNKLKGLFSKKAKDEENHIEEGIAEEDQAEEEVEETKKKSTLSKIKGLFGKSNKDDDEDDDEWNEDDDDEEDDDDWDDEDEDEDDDEDDDKTGVTQIGSLPQAESKKPDLKLVANESTRDSVQLSDLDLDESKDFEIDEMEDDGHDHSVTNINIAELNETLKDLEEEGKEAKKSGFFQSLFNKKEDEELEFGEEDGEDEIDITDTNLDEPSSSFSVDDATDPDGDIDFDTTDPNIGERTQETPIGENTVVEKEAFDSVADEITAGRDKIDKKYSEEDGAPSLAKAAKKSKKKFSPGPSPWILARLGAFLTSLIFVKVLYNGVFEIAGIQQSYDEFASSAHELLKPYFKIYIDYLLIILNTLPKHIPQLAVPILDLQLNTKLRLLGEFTFFKYFFLFMSVELFFTLIFGVTFPQLVMGIKSTGSTLSASLKGLIRNTLAIFTLPLMVFVLPVIFRLPSLNELLTFSRLYYEKTSRMILGAVHFTVLLVVFYLMPFLDFDSAPVPILTVGNELKIAQITEDGTTNFRSKELALKGTFTKNVKFTYFPFWEKNNDKSIYFSDSFLGQSAIITISKRVDTDSLIQELYSNFPGLVLLYKPEMKSRDFAEFLATSFVFDIKNPISIVNAIQKMNYHSHALAHYKKKIVNDFELQGATRIEMQADKSRVFFNFTMPKKGKNNVSYILSVGKYDTRLFKVFYENKSKAKNRLIRHVIGGSTTLSVLPKDYEQYNAFTAFDFIKRYEDGSNTQDDDKNLFDFYFNIGRSILNGEDQLQREYFSKTLKNLIGKLKRLEQTSSGKLAEKLDELLAATENLDKAYFTKNPLKTKKKSLYSPKKSSSKVEKRSKRRSKSSNRKSRKRR